MLTEGEARKLYGEILGRVGGALARDIEVNVFRSAHRSPATTKQSPLFSKEVRSEFNDAVLFSHRDALVVALRTLLSALDPIFQLHEVQQVTRAKPEEDRVEKHKQLVWDFDRAALALVEEASDTSPSQLVNIEPVPQLLVDDLARTRQRVERLARFVREFEDELEKEAE